MLSTALPSNGRLVNIGTHALALYTHGPEPSSPNDPVVLFVSRVASDALNWQAVVRQLPPSLRSYTYDRSGYNNSDHSPLVSKAENVALELSRLIEAATITNSLILVGRSWAGVLIHEFITLKDCASVLNVNDPILWTLAEGVDPCSAWGVEANHKLTAEEWAAFRAAEWTDKFEVIANQEEEQYFFSFEILRKKELSKRQSLLGDKPVFMPAGKRSRDWSGLYEAGVAKRNGDEEQRAHVRNMIANVDEKTEGLMKKFLKLSTKSELVLAKKSGHFVQMTQPEIVVDGIKWVLENQAALF